jgi:hypothetical protein
MDAWAKWVYSGEKCAMRFLNVEYLQIFSGDFLPIHLKKAGLLAK